ncbi:MAG: NADH-quinone oxidoreductase subunit N [Archangiaceae bacterium]|nr:NADH-quinone oxidoreductase subunit N [Archangiaceae bacterium]
MTIPEFTMADFWPVIPAGILTAAAIVLMISEVFLGAAASRTYQSLLSVLACVLAGAVALMNMTDTPRAVLQGYAVMDPFSSFLTLVVCVGTGLAALLAAGFLQHRNAERGEFYALMLFAAAGMTLLGLSNEFITLFVNLEVLSVATYALTAWLRRGSRPSEGAFKYFILGAFAAALMLYGAALLYGATGTTHLTDMAAKLRAALAETDASGGHPKQMLIYAGFLLVGAGFAFKVAAVPFHMWTPDVYEGAPTPVTALMSAGVKAAAFVALVRVFMALGPAVDPQLPFIAFSVLALLTMVVGNLLALPQRNVKRMLAYSSIAHAGYLLLGVAALFAVGKDAKVGVLSSTPLVGISGSMQSDVYQGILFYLLGYTVTAIGAFGTIVALERREDETKGNAWDLDRFAGLGSRKPGWALAMTVFMLSLGGVPPTVGFIGKVLLFRAAVDAGLLGLSIVGMLASAAGVYYYLRVVVYMYMRPAPEGALVPERRWTTELALVATAAGTVLFGVLPGPITALLQRTDMLFHR